MMRLTALILVLGLGLAAPAAAPWVAAAGAAQTITIKMASFTPARSNVVLGSYKPFMNAVKSELGNQIEFQEYWGGALGRNPTKQYELVKNGIADVNLVVPGYTPGQFPGFSIFELPYLIRSGEEGSVTLWRFQARTGMLGGLGDIHVLSLYTSEPYGFHTVKPMTSLGDVKGMKIRTAGPVQAAIAKHYGGVAVGMAAPRIAEALRRGVLDGVLIGWGGANTFKTFPVTKHHDTSPLGVLPFIIGFNKAKWDSLPDNIKAVFNKYGGEPFGRNGGRQFDRTAARLSNKLKADGSRKFFEPTAEDLQRGLEFTKPVHDGWIKNTKNGAAIYDGVNKVLVEVRSGT